MRKPKIEWPFVKKGTLQKVIEEHNKSKSLLESQLKSERERLKKEIEEEKNTTSAVLKTIQKLEPQRYEDDTLILNLAIKESFLRQAIYIGENDRHFWEAIADRLSWEMKRNLIAMSLSGFRRSAHRVEERDIYGRRETLSWRDL